MFVILNAIEKQLCSCDTCGCSHTNYVHKRKRFRTQIINNVAQSIAVSTVAIIMVAGTAHVKIVLDSLLIFTLPLSSECRW